MDEFGEQMDMAMEETEELRRDAERYRWMRQKLQGYKWRDAGPLEDIRPPDEKYINGPGLDAAIDVALRA